MTTLVFLALFAGTASYSRALGAPGHATFTDKSSAWAHDHHMGPAVDLVEDWVYSRHHLRSRDSADSFEASTRHRGR